jgi:hypothetical protein
MPDNKLGFDFTIEDLDRMVIEAATGEGGSPNQAKGIKPNAIKELIAKAKLGAEPTKK